MIEGRISEITNRAGIIIEYNSAIKMLNLKEKLEATNDRIRSST